VQEAVHPEANIIFGATIEDTLGDEVRVTVIAAGFDGGEPTYRKFEASALGVAALAAASEAATASADQEEQDLEIVEVTAPSFEFSEDSEQAVEVKQKVSTPGYFGDDLDLPEFFR